MKRKLMTLVLSIAVIVSLVLIGCAPAAAPPEEEEAPPEEEEEAPPAAPEAEELEIKMANFLARGDHGMNCERIRDVLAEASGGRIKVTILPEATVTPVPEHLDATSAGVFDLCYMWLSYYGGTYPVLGLFNYPVGLRMPADAWSLDKEGGWDELAEKVWAKLNIHFIGNSAKQSDSLVSRVPISSMDDLEGMKLRSSDLNAKAMELLGASTVFIQDAAEIYTSLASGLIDATDNYDVANYYDTGYYEVAKYWMMPPLTAVVQSTFVANMDFWNSLSSADKRLIEVAHAYATDYTRRTNDYRLDLILAEVQAEYGVTLGYWSDADQAKWANALTEAFERHPEDPDWVEAYELLEAHCEKIY